MATEAGCREAGKNLRGAEKSPGRTATAYRSPVAAYDAKTDKTTWADQDDSAKIAYDGGAAQLLGEDSWKSLLLKPSGPRRGLHRRRSVRAARGHLRRPGHG